MLYHFGSGQNNCLADKKKKANFSLFSGSKWTQNSKRKKIFPAKEKVD